MVSHLITHLGQGGAERYISDLAQYSKNSDYPMEIYCLYNTRESKVNLSRIDGSIKVKTLLNLSSFSYVSNIVKIVKVCIFFFLPVIMLIYGKYLKKNNIKFVVLSLSTPSLFILLRFFYRRIEFIHLFHTNWHLLKNVHQAIFSISFSLGKTLVTEIGGEVMGRQLAERWNLNHVYIPFSITSKLERYSRIESSDDVCRIFTVCRIRRFEKRLDEMIALCLILVDRGIHFSFDIYGDGEDSPWLRQQIERYNLQLFVKLHGYTRIEDIRLNSFDFGLFTTVNGQPGIAGLEVESAGCPILRLETVEGCKTFESHHGYTAMAIADSLSLNNINVQKEKSINNMVNTFSQWENLFQNL